MGPARALIIEDDEVHAALLQQTLEAEGFATDTATDVAAALEKLGSGHWDLVTLDTSLLSEERQPLERDGGGLARRLAELNIVFLCVTVQPSHLVPREILLAGPVAHVAKDGESQGLAAALKKARSVRPDFRRLCIEEGLYQQLSPDERLRYRERALEQVSPWLERYCAREGVECVALSGPQPQLIWAGDMFDMPPLSELEAQREDPSFPVFRFGRRVIVRRAVIGVGNRTAFPRRRDYLITLRATLGARDWPPEQIHSHGLHAYGEFDTGGPFCLVQAAPADADRILGDEQIDRWANIGGVDVLHQCGWAAVLLGNPQARHCTGICRCGLVTRGRLRDAMRDWPDDFNALLGRDILFRLDVQVMLDGRGRKTAVPATGEEFDWREVT